MTEKPYEKLRCFGRAYDDTMKTAKPIDALLRKEFAIEILRGEKQNEFRTFSEFWISRLCTRDAKTKCIAGIKPFKIIHFHNYNNSWFLDCEVEAVNCCEIDEAFAECFSDEVDITGVDLTAEESMFVMRLGKVVATNLQVD